MKIGRFQQFKWIICTKVIAKRFSLFDSTNLNITKLSLHFSIIRALFSVTAKKRITKSWTKIGEQNEININWNFEFPRYEFLVTSVARYWNIRLMRLCTVGWIHQVV